MMDKQKELQEEFEARLIENAKQFRARKETISELTIYLVKLDLEELRTNSVEEIVDRFFQQRYQEVDKPFELSGE